MILFKNTLRHMKYTLKTRYTICIDNGVANHMKCETMKQKTIHMKMKNREGKKSKQTNSIVYD